jgi:tetratricopeptide (TPR) repeat protein
MESWPSYLRGRLLELFGRVDAAIEAYRETLGIDAGFSRAANRLAYLLAGRGGYREAEPLFRRVLQAEPENATLHFNLGFTLEKLQRFEEAIESFSEATRLKPGTDRAWYGMGMCQAHLGRHEQAVPAFEKAAKLQPMNPHAWYALGMAHYATHNPENLKGVILHLVRFDPRMARRLIIDSESTNLAYLVKDLVV